MEPDGRLVPHGAAALIFVREDRPLARQRFTIAHELAHWCLRNDALRTPLARRVAASFTSEEVMCNVVAGSLLMPQPWLAHLWDTASWMRDPSLSALSYVATEAEVSLEAAAIRLRSAYRWPVTLLHWTRDGHRWFFESEAGLPPGQLEYVVPSRHAATQLTQAGLRSARAQTWLLPMRIGPYEDTYEVELMVRREDAVALVDLAKAGVINDAQAIAVAC